VTDPVARNCGTGTTWADAALGPTSAATREQTADAAARDRARRRLEAARPVREPSARRAA
jgi:hypothetical protein